MAAAGPGTCLEWHPYKAAVTYMSGLVPRSIWKPQGRGDIVPCDLFFYPSDLELPKWGQYMAGSLLTMGKGWKHGTSVPPQGHLCPLLSGLEVKVTPCILGEQFFLGFPRR